MTAMILLIKRLRGIADELEAVVQGRETVPYHVTGSWP